MSTTITTKDGVDVTKYLTKEIHSESTLPLLSYFHGCRSGKVPATDVFTRVKAEIGKADRLIPDEAEQLESALLTLIEKGPSKNNEKIKGDVKVSSTVQPYHNLFKYILKYILITDDAAGHNRWCGGIWPLRRLRTQESWL